MKWNLRLVAAQREIWRASELNAMFREAGLEISSGKMSGLWSGQPASIKLDELDVMCAVLNCRVDDLLVAEPDSIERDSRMETSRAVNAGNPSTPVPRRRNGRSLPPA